MKKNLIFTCALTILLCLGLAACGGGGSGGGGSEPEAPAMEMTTIEFADYGNPIISIDIPTEGDYVPFDTTIGNGIALRHGEIDIYLGMDDQSYYEGSTEVYATFEEVTAYLIELGLDTIGEASFSGMTGISQDRDSSMIFIFPVADEMQRWPDAPQMLELRVNYNVRDENNMLMADQFPVAREAIQTFINSDEGQAILNSVVLTAGN